MNKIAKPYLEDIHKAIFLIEKYITQAGRDKNVFLNDLLLQDGILRRLEIIGEATKRLPMDFREAHPQVPWRLMTGLRDVLIHDYDEVNLEQIWKVIEEDLIPLKKDIEQLLKED